MKSGQKLAAQLVTHHASMVVIPRNAPVALQPTVVALPLEGATVGACVTLAVGVRVGAAVIAAVGTAVGAAVVPAVGAAVAAAVGAAVGAATGAATGVATAGPSAQLLMVMPLRPPRLRNSTWHARAEAHRTPPHTVKGATHQVAWSLLCLWSMQVVTSLAMDAPHWGVVVAGSCCWQCQRCDCCHGKPEQSLRLNVHVAGQLETGVVVVEAGVGAGVGKGDVLPAHGAALRSAKQRSPVGKQDASVPEGQAMPHFEFASLHDAPQRRSTRAGAACVLTRSASASTSCLEAGIGAERVWRGVCCRERAC